MRKKRNISRIRVNSQGEKEKTCTRCGLWYPADSRGFHRDSHHKDSLMAECKFCRNEARTMKRQTPEGKEKQKEWNRRRKERSASLKQENEALRAEIERLKGRQTA